MCFGGGGGGGSTVSNKFDPPAWTTDGSANGGTWQQYLARAADLTAQAPTMYAGQTVADLSPQTQQGMDLISQTAMNSSPDVRAGRQAVTNIAGGQYLDSNPYVQQNSGYTQQVMADNANNMARGFANGTAAQNDALAARQGAYGGSAWQQKQSMDAQGLANSIGQMGNQYNMQRSSLGAQNYQQGVNQMLGAAGMAPQLQNMDFQAGQQLAGVGDMQRSYQQQLLDAMKNQFNQGQMAPFQNLDVFGNALSRASGGVAGGSTSSQTTNGGGFSPLAGLLGAGAIGYGVLGGG